MSVVRTTNTIEEIDLPSNNRNTLLDLLTSVAGVTVQGMTALGRAASDAYGQMQIAAQPLPSASSPALRPPSLQAARAMVQVSPDARTALETLGRAASLEIPDNQAHSLANRIDELIRTNDLAGVETLAVHLIEARQERLREGLIQKVEQAAVTIGFTPKILSLATSTVVAKDSTGRLTLGVEVEKTADGFVRMHRDTDGFRGDACVKVMDAHSRALRSLGVRFTDASSRRKRPPVILGGCKNQAKQQQGHHT
jgi:hypothetical protein